MSLQSLIALIPYTHVYWCPKGGHYGVICYDSPFCPMGCNA